MVFMVVFFLVRFVEGMLHTINEEYQLYDGCEFLRMSSEKMLVRTFQLLLQLDYSIGIAAFLPPKSQSLQNKKYSHNNLKITQILS